MGAILNTSELQMGLHADSAGHGIEPELDHRLPDPDRADQAVAGSVNAG
jgi:hypothetical protein